MGSDQSRTVMTTLRSTPVGRGGVALGSSPALMRSVQSASAARWPPSGVNIGAMKLTMPLPAGPDWMRRAHAAIEESKWPSAAGMVRVA